MFLGCVGGELCCKSLEPFLVRGVPVQAAQEHGEHQTPSSCSSWWLKSFMKSCFCSAWLCNSHTSGSINSPDKLDGMDALKFKNSWCFFILTLSIIPSLECQAFVHHLFHFQECYSFLLLNFQSALLLEPEEGWVKSCICSGSDQICSASK